MSDMREPGPRSKEIVERERRHAAAGLQGFALYAGLVFVVAASVLPSCARARLRQESTRLPST